VTRAALLLLLVLVALAGCGGGDHKRTGSAATSTPSSGPALGRGGGDDGGAPAPAATPAPLEVTKNTTRVGGRDAVADAAGVAEAVFPARTPEERPQAVALVDVRQPQSAISAALLMARPLQAPVLFTDGSKLPDATRQALRTLAPTGAQKAGRAQVIRVGDTPAPPSGLRSTQISGGSPEEVAAAVARFAGRAAGHNPTAVVVAPSDRLDLAMPAAAWAAKSGDPVLWAGRDALPRETVAALKSLRRPKIYVLGPPEAISDAVLKQLGRVGAAKRIGTSDPVTNAIFFARYSDGTFGWNVVDPGHGLVFANVKRVADAAAAAPLSAAGTYGPLLLLPQAATMPKPLQDYLLDIQPGYDRDPVRGVYNHGWLVGDESAISADVQSRLDALLEIQPVDTGGE
jgi:ell wall binding domain 2 (CWB2)